MSVSLEKLEREAPHLVDLYKGAVDLMKEEGLDPEKYKAGVVTSFDLSGSTEMDKNHLYSGRDRLMQNLGNIGFAAGFAFDDDGKIPASFFHSSIVDLGHVTPETSRDFLQIYKKHTFGGTSYTAALRWMVEQAGFDGVNLGSIKAWAYALRTGDFSGVQPLEVKGTAKYPTYGLLATDGEPMDDPWELLAYIYLISQIPLFIECVGVGHNRPFKMLEKFDKLPSLPNDRNGRYIDNIGAFDSAEAKGDPKKMLQLMLGEFPAYYAKAFSRELLVR